MTSGTRRCHLPPYRQHGKASQSCSNVMWYQLDNSGDVCQGPLAPSQRVDPRQEDVREGDAILLSRGDFFFISRRTPCRPLSFLQPGNVTYMLLLSPITTRHVLASMSESMRLLISA